MVNEEKLERQWQRFFRDPEPTEEERMIQERRRKDREELIRQLLRIAEIPNQLERKGLGDKFTPKKKKRKRR